VALQVIAPIRPRLGHELVSRLHATAMQVLRLALVRAVRDRRTEVQDFSA
jgi:hypothetical protein